MRRYTIVVNGKQLSLDVQELAADRFRVTVDGREAEVQLAGEADLPEASITPAIIGVPTVSAAAPAPSEHQYSSGAPPAPVVLPAGAGGVSNVTAPMPGVIVAIDTALGAPVNRGDTLVTLEAMKMKNAIRATRSGKVIEIRVEPGQQVGFGDVLVRLEERAQ